MKPIYFFWVVFAISIYWMGYLYYDFLMNILIAALLSVASFWLKDFFDRFIKYNFLSSFFCVLTLLAFLIIPLYFVIHNSVNILLKVNPDEFNPFVESVKMFIGKSLEYFPSLKAETDSFISSISPQGILKYILHFGSYIGKYSINFAIDTGFIVIFLFFFFYYGRNMYVYIIKLLPFDISQSIRISAEISGVVKVVFLTSIANVFLQGIAFGGMIFWFGYDGFLLGILYGITSLIPVVGGAIIWIPIGIYEIYLGNMFGGIFIAVYSAIFIGFVLDNLVKPILITFIKHKILKTPLDINEMLIFFSIIAGLSSFGFWGIVVGPAITAFFIGLLRLYKNNFAYKKDNKKEVK